MNFERFGGRSFFLTVSTAAAAFVWRWFDKLDNPTFGMLMTGTVIAYIAKSGWDEHSKTRADVQKTIAAAQVEAAPPTVVEQVA
jgi:hypothetical protein